ncbi:MAG: 7-cyano-7-deazaguanine synthase, partial [Nitrososphaeraceae archaeon]|nr:7-cyano-7-deazaguanine synthase [Nitrososphaeraceae archaeon]
TRKSAVCIVSGGLDSVCTTASLVKEGYTIHMITFVYGQRARLEIQAAKRFARILEIEDHRIIDISFMKEIYGRTNVITDPNQNIPEDFDYSIVVPLRNAVFVTIATAWAMSIGAELVAYGAHIDDKRYPDCRPAFIKSITKALNLAEAEGVRLGLRRKITVWSPAIDGIGKSSLLSKGYRILGDKIFDTWSCYSDGVKNKGKNPIHCGKCESCINRKNAITKAGIVDKTCYAN